MGVVASTAYVHSPQKATAEKSCGWRASSMCYGQIVVTSEVTPYLSTVGTPNQVNMQPRFSDTRPALHARACEDTNKDTNR